MDLYKTLLRTPGTSFLVEFLKTPCFYTEQGEIIVNKISAVNQCARDITGHFPSSAAEVPEGDDKTEVRVRIFWWHFRFMQGKIQKEFCVEGRRIIKSVLRL